MAERSSVIYFFFFFMNVNFGLTFDTTMSKKKIKKMDGNVFCLLKACSLQLISISPFKTKTNDKQL